jgi:hypothetical protein
MTTWKNGYHTGLRRLLLPHKQTAQKQRQGVKEILSNRIVGYSPELGRIVGGVTTGVYLCQLMFLSDKGNDPEGWIYKSEAEMGQETGLTKREQQTARKKLLKLGVIEIKRGGWRNMYHFRIDWENLLAVIADYQREQTGGTGGVNQQTGGTAYPEQYHQNGATPTSEQQQSVSTQRTQTVPTEWEQTSATECTQTAATQNRDYNRENNQERTGRENELTQTDTREPTEREADSQTTEQGTPDAATTWNQTLKILKEQVSAPTFATWLKDTALLAVTDRVAKIAVSSGLAAAWLERRLYWGIVRALRDVLQQDVEVQFVTA